MTYNLSFEEWLEHVFGHEVRLRGNPWYFDPDAPRWSASPADALVYVTRLCEEAAKALARFGDDQLSEGLTYLFDTTATGDPGWFCCSAISVELRLQAIRSLHGLFENVFQAKCAPVLSHLDEDGALRLNRNCYMWWDTFPSLARPDDPMRMVVHEAALETMRRTLTLRSIACQEAALHGLGHWCRDHPIAVVHIIDEYLRSAHPVRLDRYAKAARCGCVN
jgi:hypothetical protein